MTVYSRADLEFAQSVIEVRATKAEVDDVERALGNVQAELTRAKDEHMIAVARFERAWRELQPSPNAFLV